MNDAVEILRSELEKLAESPVGRAVNASVSDGKNASDFNLRADFPGVESSTILVGVYEDGRVWSYSNRTLGEWATKLNALLMKPGIGFHCDHGSESYWYLVGSDSPFVLSMRRVGQIVNIVKELFAEAASASRRAPLA
jgi:hypothetical protein